MKQQKQMNSEEFLKEFNNKDLIKIAGVAEKFDPKEAGEGLVCLVINKKGIKVINKVKINEAQTNQLAITLVQILAKLKNVKIEHAEATTDVDKTVADYIG